MSTIFQKIIDRTIDAEIIYEDQKIIAFKDKFPKRPGHFLVVPKQLAQDLSDITDKELTYLMLKSRELALAQIKILNVSGFNLIVNSGKAAGQEIFHVHVHIVPSIV